MYRAEVTFKEGLWPGGYVPRFDEYFAPVDDAGPEVQAYYRWLCQELDEWRTPDVDGQVSYLFRYIYGIVEHYVRYRHYDLLAERFTWLRNAYGHTKIRSYLDHWQADAAILSGRWTESFQLRQRPDIAYIRHLSTLGPSPLLAGDTVYKLAGSRVPLTSWGARRRKSVIETAGAIATERHGLAEMNFIDEVFAHFPLGYAHLTDTDIDVLVDELDNGLDLTALTERLRSAVQHATPLDAPRMTELSAFDGVPVYAERKAVPAVAGFYAALVEHRARWLLREAENRLRRDAGVPEVGDGWVSETELFNLVRDAFPSTRVSRHARPVWLAPQHLDVFLPHENIALEFQGEQHYKPVEIFGGEPAFVRQLERDARKRAACVANGCHLIEVRARYDPDELLRTIRSAMSGAHEAT